MTELGRRHLLVTLGAGLMTPRRVFAEGGRLIVEHYERGDDETWGRPLGVAAARTLN